MLFPSTRHSNVSPAPMTLPRWARSLRCQVRLGGRSRPEVWLRACLLAACATVQSLAAPLAAMAATGLGTGVPSASSVAQAPSTLVLYDTTGPWGVLGEGYALQAANLVSHFGPWLAEPVARYTPGQANAFTAVVYLGSTYDEPLPRAFVDDIQGTAQPVIWAGANLWQLTRQYPDFPRSRGWMWKGYDFSTLTGVTYKGIHLERDAQNKGGILVTTILDPAKAQVLAQASRAEGGYLPWAVRSRNFTYISEIPFVYVGANDRYLVFADLLFDALAPATASRHRALVRLEDVGPDANPAELRTLADVLAARKIPFSVAVYPAYRDPLGAHNQHKATAYDLSAVPEVVKALGYLQTKGGTLIMHGYTHQFAQAANPYSGTSADDFEFFLAHVDGGNSVVFDGPVPGDSQAWALARLDAGLGAFTAAGLSPPTIFEPPHYTGSMADYQAFQARFGVRYDRGTYFPGTWSEAGPDFRKPFSQFFPYLVRDVYGSLVIPENLGNVAVAQYNNHDTRFPADILASASRNFAVRDGFASFFYHPHLGPARLAEILDGLLAQGWTFVPVGSVIR